MHRKVNRIIYFLRDYQAVVVFQDMIDNFCLKNAIKGAVTLCMILVFPRINFMLLELPDLQGCYTVLF